MTTPYAFKNQQMSIASALNITRQQRSVCSRCLYQYIARTVWSHHTDCWPTVQVYRQNVLLQV